MVFWDFYIGGVSTNKPQRHGEHGERKGREGFFTFCLVFSISQWNYFLVRNATNLWVILLSREE